MPLFVKSTPCSAPAAAWVKRQRGEASVTSNMLVSGVVGVCVAVFAAHAICVAVVCAAVSVFAACASFSAAAAAAVCSKSLLLLNMRMLVICCGVSKDCSPPSPSLPYVPSPHE